MVQSSVKDDCTIFYPWTIIIFLADDAPSYHKQYIVIAWICCISVNRFCTISIHLFLDYIKNIDKIWNIEQKACYIQKKTLPLPAILGKMCKFKNSQVCIKRPLMLYSPKEYKSFGKSFSVMPYRSLFHRVWKRWILQWLYQSWKLGNQLNNTTKNNQ